jgi:arginine:pyruvate transaminase
VVSDEVYAELVFDGHFKPFTALEGMAERTVTVASLSKSHAMTGWRIGWIIAPNDLITHADHLALCSLYGIAGFIQEAALTAIADTDAVAREMREIYERRCKVLCDGIDHAPGLKCLRPASGMFALVDVRETGLSAHEFAWGLFKAEGVSVLDASAFGPSAEGYVRVAFTVGEEELAEAGRRITRYAISLTGQA